MKKLALALILLPILAIPRERIIRIGVIDNGFMDLPPTTTLCSPIKAENKDGHNEEFSHGSYVVQLIHHNTHVRHCFVLIDVFDKKGRVEYTSLVKALEYMRTQKVDIINLSMEGPDPFYLEEVEIKKLLDSKTLIVVASGNRGIKEQNPCTSYPACYDKRIIVASDVHESANDGAHVDYYADGNYKGSWGTSFSAARISSIIANKAEKEKAKIYP